MSSNAINQKIAESLSAILERLDRHEAVINRLAAASTSGAAQAERTNDAETELFMMRLSKLTLKRHAVLTATLSGKSYQQIADLMHCDTTTVKLHLRNALQILGIQSRSILLTSHIDMLKDIDDKVYRARFGISKRWWMEDDPAVMAVLQTTKNTANQYTKEKGSAETD